MGPPQLTTINVSLPTSLKFVCERVRTQGYGSVSQYVRMLIRQAWEEARGEEVSKASKRNWTGR